MAKSRAGGTAMYTSAPAGSMIARRPTKLGANNRPVPSISIARPSRLSPSANARATYSNCSGRVTALARYTRYVHTTEVLASTRSPWLNTGPLPANRFRTVRNTISPSSAIQRRCQAPQPNSTATTATLTQRLARTVMSYGNEALPTALSAGQRGVGLGPRWPRQPRKTATPTVPIKARNSTCSTRSRSAMSSGSPARPPSTSTA